MKLGYIFVGFFLVSVGIVLFGEAGLLSAYKLSQGNARLEDKINVLQRENAMLLRQVEGVEKSPRQMEHVIRASLSLVASDELLFEFQLSSYFV